MKHKLQSFTTLPFLLCLGLLLINDFYLKETFHNGLTGKLSDHCGLYIFPIFWSAFFYKKKNEIYIITALLFVLWKSPFSQVFIDLFSQNIYPIFRVVDITDLWALGILPFSYLSDSRAQFRLNLNPYILGLIGFFTFCGTSFLPHYQEFKNPQYILLKPVLGEPRDKGFRSIPRRMEFEKFEVEGGQLLEIKAISLIYWSRSKAYWPKIIDEFHKVLVLQKVDEMAINYFNSFTMYEPDIPLILLDSLIIEGDIYIELDKAAYIEELNFQDSRLHGPFLSKSYDDKPLIQGFFRNGIEDSTWVYFNEESEIIKKEIYSNGELNQVILYENEKVIDREHILTRKQEIERIQFLISFLILLSMGGVVLLIQNHLKNKKVRNLKFPHGKKIMLALCLPIFPILLFNLYEYFSSSVLLTISYSRLIRFITDYILYFPIFLFIIYILKPPKLSTFVLYIVLISLVAIIFGHDRYLMALCENLNELKI